jgi:pseudouridine-5'-phosphate glycosidase
MTAWHVDDRDPNREQETLGVPVIPWNETKEFPAFWSPKSGYKVPWSTSDPAVAAKILRECSIPPCST